MHLLFPARFAGPGGLLRPCRAGVLLAAAGLATIGVAAVPAGPASAEVPAARSASAVPAPGLPLSAQRPLDAARASKPLRGVRSACPAPSRVGQMQCMALVRTGTRHYLGVVAHQVPSGYGPSDLQSAYNLSTASAQAGTGEKVAVVDAYDDPDAAADLAVYRAQYGLPACDTSTGAGCVTKVNEEGQASPLPPADPSGDGWEQEESLDLDMVSAICPHCGIVLVEANSNSIPDLGTAEQTAAASADFVTNSWNGLEFSTEDYYDNLYFNHPGVAITDASGESGYGTTWPTSSQYLTAVGGTTLTADAGASRGWTETAWNDGNGSATGSGCSLAEPKPSWQAMDDTAPSGCLNRTENDVSAVADPDTGVAMYDSYGSGGGWSVAGGTSVAAPIIASVYALAGTPAAGTYPASYLYQSGHAAGLYDVTSGSDGHCEKHRQYLCHAETGYDGPTGWGTPDGTAAFANSVTGNVVTILDPGVQDLEAGTPVFVAMQGTDSADLALSYSATGLPAGLSIGASSGRITGTLGSSASTNTVTVTAKDSTGASGSVKFSMVVVTSLRTDYDGVSGPVDLDLGGKCLDDYHDGTSPGSVVDIWSCNGGAAQDWEYQPDGSPGGAGTLTIHGLCADLAGGATGQETKIELESCDGDASQQWLIVGSSGELYNTDAGQCLTDPDGTTVNGTQVWIDGCTGSASQAWTLPASPVQSGVTGFCMDDYHDQTANGNKIQVWDCNGGAAQKWADEPDGTLRLDGGKCLTVDGSSMLDGAAVILDACNSDSSTNANQHWIIGPGGELINANSGRCLDDPGNSGTEGTGLIQEDCYGQPGEIWAVT